MLGRILKLRPQIALPGVKKYAFTCHPPVKKLILTALAGLYIIEKQYQ